MSSRSLSSIPSLLALIPLAVFAQCRNSSSGNNNDAPNTIIVAAVNLDESKLLAVVTLQRRAFTEGAISLDYATADGTATAPLDYQATTGSVSWSPTDQADKIVQIPITDDSLMEPEEQFELTISNVQGGTFPGGPVPIIVQDDDQPVAPDLASHQWLTEYENGSTTMSVGDLDQDGSADIGFGDTSANNDQGQVRVFSGRTGKVLYARDGAPGQKLGAFFASPGDVDGDKQPDLAVHSTDALDRWTVETYSGRTRKILHTIKDDLADPRPISSITGIGDVNKDGYDDFLLSQPDDKPSGQGFVSVRSGWDGSEIGRVQANVPGRGFGHTVGAAGDVNGDDHADFFVTAPGTTNLPESSVTLYSGIDLSIAFTVQGPSGTGFGEAAALVGDVDGDGQPEIAVGEPRGMVNGETAGRLHVYSIANRAALMTLDGAPQSGFGSSVAGADLDRDGRVDLIVGAPGERSLTTYSGATGRMIQRFEALEIGFGSRVEVLGDTNSDDEPELLVSSDKVSKILSTRRLTLVADTRTITVSAEGRQTLNLSTGAIGIGRRYLLLGSLGTSRGFFLNQIHVPLDTDVWMRTTLQFANTPTLHNTLGEFDSEGKAIVTINTPIIRDARLVGLTFYHGFVVYDDSHNYHHASNPVPLTTKL